MAYISLFAYVQIFLFFIIILFRTPTSNTFIFRTLHRKLFTNEKLYKIGLITLLSLLSAKTAQIV